MSKTFLTLYRLVFLRKPMGSRVKLSMDTGMGTARDPGVTHIFLCAREEVELGPVSVGDQLLVSFLDAVQKIYHTCYTL